MFTAEGFIVIPGTICPEGIEPGCMLPAITRFILLLTGKLYVIALGIIMAELLIVIFVNL